MSNSKPKKLQSKSNDDKICILQKEESPLPWTEQQKERFKAALTDLLRDGKLICGTSKAFSSNMNQAVDLVAAAMLAARASRPSMPSAGPRRRLPRPPSTRVGPRAPPHTLPHTNGFSATPSPRPRERVVMVSIPAGPRDA